MTSDGEVDDINAIVNSIFNTRNQRFTRTACIELVVRMAHLVSDDVGMGRNTTHPWEQIRFNHSAIRNGFATFWADIIHIQQHVTRCGRSNV